MTGEPTLEHSVPTRSRLRGDTLVPAAESESPDSIPDYDDSGLFADTTERELTHPHDDLGLFSAESDTEIDRGGDDGLFSAELDTAVPGMDDDESDLFQATLDTEISPPAVEEEEEEEEELKPSEMETVVPAAGANPATADTAIKGNPLLEEEWSATAETVRKRTPLFMDRRETREPPEDDALVKGSALAAGTIWIVGMLAAAGAGGVIVLGLGVAIWFAAPQPGPEDDTVPATPHEIADVAPVAQAEPAPEPDDRAPSPASDAEPAPEGSASPEAEPEPEPASEPEPEPDGRGADTTAHRFPGSFGFNQWKPQAVDNVALGRLIATLQACPAGIEVVGHSDDRGRARVNEQFAKARAVSVSELLARRGIPASSIRVVSEGSSAPDADNDSAQGRALNRRVMVSCAD